MSDFAVSSLSARCDTLLLGRLGSELALIYHDTLQSPVPAQLKAIIDRLESVSFVERESETID